MMERPECVECDTFHAAAAVHTDDASPCPFCGKRPVIQPWHGGGPRKRMVLCDYLNCPANPSVTGGTRAVALSNWNMRA
jgi:hypothetical protein